MIFIMAANLQKCNDEEYISLDRYLEIFFLNSLNEKN